MVEQFVERYGPLFVINLPNRTDRLAEFRSELLRVGLPPDHPGVRVFQAKRPSTADGFPTPGAFGCFLSHKGVLETALAEDRASVIICEDDLDFAADFRDRLPQVMDALERVRSGISSMLGIHPGRWEHPSATISTYLPCRRTTPCFARISTSSKAVQSRS